ncbi:hypothetical protein M513_10055 [Trichuris suis]|uniref:Uncharacterized protein n=1 Tax=Trichuris suis TaxID=68888 RepID=A0A085LVW7_9BILA|nr:hypothetical protein M513_10055 [Trichuris suis]
MSAKEVFALMKAQASALFSKDILKGFMQQFITKVISKIPGSGVISLSCTCLQDNFCSRKNAQIYYVVRFHQCHTGQLPVFKRNQRKTNAGYSGIFHYSSAPPEVIMTPSQRTFVASFDRWDSSTGTVEEQKVQI